MDTIFNDKRSILSVTELTRSIKSILTNNFFDIWVRGEVSNYKTATSGHKYFSLKDENSLLRAVLFKGYQSNIKFELEDGLKVIVHGNLDLFEKRGEYQIIVDYIEPEGKGALQLAFEQLKEKLKKEGLFDTEHKKPIPAFPETIGVITSATGAALRDILNVTRRRYNNIHIIIYPTLVQGEEAAKSIVDAIKKANERKEVDVIILGRGGGSIEDLWPFNEEIVARAIYESDIPIISAVGHEIDFTISDFVADLRAPTPSAAAELVVRNKEELIKWLRDRYNRLIILMDGIIEAKREKFSYYSFEKLSREFEGIINQKALELDDLSKDLHMLMESLINAKRSRFDTLIAKLNALSPLETLTRGFAIVEKLPDGKPIFSVNQIFISDNVKTILKDGYFISSIKEIIKGKSKTKTNSGDLTS
ncbi:MAG: exodeoxyribonuclease VII large subunit [Spirochaetes bacterium]|nr:MAG: exodeoxyribonuclease VII large subunit [Spirochaetota bacterium]